MMVYFFFPRKSYYVKCEKKFIRLAGVVFLVMKMILNITFYNTLPDGGSSEIVSRVGPVL